MTDITTNKPLRVLNSTVGPYIRLAFTQLDELRQILDGNGIFYWVRENAISWDGGPEMIVVNLGREGDAVKVQAILDKIGVFRNVRGGEGQSMTDTTTNKSLRVLTNSTAGPYIKVAFSQLDDIRQVLDSSGIFYWVEENAFSWNGGPEMIVIHFGREGDAVLVQEILDKVR